MKRSTSIRQLLLALMCLFGLSASAQFSATLKQGPTSDYSNVGHQFKLTEVAEALGTDTATLVAQLSDMANTKVFAVIDSTGTVNGYTGNTGEFWLTRTGQVHEYSGGAWFVGQNFDEENDIFNVYVGQMPNYFTASDTLHVKAALVLGEKTATFDITYQVYVPQAPEAELAISKLNIVGQAATSIEQYPRSAYDMDKVYVKVSDLAEKLGADKEDLSYIISKIAYLPRVDATYGMMSDSLTVASTNDGWMKRTIDSKGDSTWACGSNAYNNTDVLYVNSFNYNADNDTLTCQIGQYPGANKVGDKPNFDAYLVYGSKAYKVNYTVNIIEAPYQGLGDMTQVGDTTIVTSQQPTNDYSYTSINPDTAAIAAALGTTADNLQMQAIDGNGGLTSEYTANNGGFWLTQAGVKTAWGTGAYFFVEPVANNNFSDIHVGQYPDVAQPLDTARATLYFTSGDKYYCVNVILTIEKSNTPEIGQDQFVSVAKRTVTIQGLPADYGWSDTDSSIPVADIEAAIGTSSPVLYAYISDSLRKKSPDTYPETMIYTKTYNMTPAPGFWLDKDGKSMGWTSDEQSPWGITTTNSDGKYTFKAMQYAADAPGTAYSGQFFLVNEETGKMMTVTVNYLVVNAIQTVTEVGSTSITLPVGDTDQEVDFPIATVAEALGTDVNTLLSSYTLVGRNASGVYTDAVDPVQTGLSFATDGSCGGDNIGINFSADGTKITTYANNPDEVGEGYKAEGTIGFMVKGENDETKIYVIYVTFMNAADYATGINDIKLNNKANGKIYDLSGRQVSKPAHGLYIMNGKKYVVK